MHAVLRQVELAANQRLDARLLGFFIKLQGPVHGAMVGEGNGPHTEFLGGLYQVADADGAIESYNFV